MLTEAIYPMQLRRIHCSDYHISMYYNFESATGSMTILNDEKNRKENEEDGEEDKIQKILFEICTLEWVIQCIITQKLCLIV